MKKFFICILISGLLSGMAALGAGTCYVWQAASPVVPYTTWANAATDVQAAVDYASSNLVSCDTVMVTNGAYGLTNLLTITNGLRLVGFGGYSNTVLYRTSFYTNRVLTLSNTAAIVDGFTITNGWVRKADGTVAQGYNGGGVYMYGGTLRNCRVQYNRADNGGGGNNQRGGGIYMVAGTVSNCLVSGNSMDGQQMNAGGVQVNGGTLQNCVVQANVIRGSNAEKGSGVCVDNAGVVENCLVSGNVAQGAYTDKGAGIQVINGTVRNCTVAGNIATNHPAAGIHRDAGSVFNCIVYGNVSVRNDNAGTQINATNGFSYSCAPELVSGVLSNVSADPQFVNAAAGNYRLGAASPCLNAGTNHAGVVGADLDGNPRLAQGRADMGAYEQDTAAGSLTCDFAGSAVTAFDSVQVIFTSYVAGATAATNITWYAWDFGNGTAAGATLSVVTNTFGLGTYAVSLTVSNDVPYATNRVKTGYLRVYPSTNYVWSGSTAPVWPYATWATAATNPADAVSAAGVVGNVGTLVLVTNGMYAVTNELRLSSVITLRGLNGYADTTIYRSGASSYRVLRLSHANAAAEGLTVSNGVASVGGGGAGGGGVLVDTGTLRYSRIRNNRGDHSGGGNTQQGGGIYLAGGTVSDCLVSENLLGPGTGEQMSGAGVAVFGGVLRNTIVQSNVVYGTTYERGSGVYISSASGLVEGCLVAGNIARGKPSTAASRTGAGVYIASGLLRSCTIAGNSASNTQVNGLFRTGGAVTNCIIYDNVSPAFVGIASNLCTTGGVFYSCAPELTAGAGNTNAAPQLKANLTLNSGSPCINAGTNETWMATGVDLAGTSRTVDSIVDMGAYEFVATAGPFGCNYTTVPSIPKGFDELLVAFTASASGTDTNVVYYWWDFGDGATDQGAAKQIVSHQYIASSNYTVSLTSSNQSGQVTSATGTVWVYPSTNYVSPLGAHVFPFTSWANASTTLQAAVDAAWWNGAVGTLVVVTNGNYATRGEIDISKNITVRSVNGAANTTVYRDNSVTCRVFGVRMAGAVLDGFTVTNGYAIVGGGSQGGGGILLVLGTVRNCRVLYNKGDHSGGGNNQHGGGVFMTAGTVENCLIFGNALNNGEQMRGGGVYLQGGTLRNSTIGGNTLWGTTWERGTGIYVDGAGAVVENCLVVSNVALGRSTSDDGPGAYISAGILRSSTVSGNVSTNHQVSGIYRSGGSVTNTIAYGNRGVRGGYTSADVNTSLGFAYCCAPELSNGMGNITNSPRFNGEAVGDFTLQGGSPCLNTGTNETWMTNAVDLVGRRRVFGGVVDMGAYENPNNPGSIYCFR